jgi:RNA polymerase sigma factor (sigma-70 family)
MSDEIRNVCVGEADLSEVINGNREAWERVVHVALQQLAAGQPEPWKLLIACVLDEDKGAHGHGVLKNRLYERLVGRSAIERDSSGLELLVAECLARVSQKDQYAWKVLQEFTYHLLIRKCETMLRTKISKSNPLITANTLAAEVFLRLNNAIFEKTTVTPKTSREYFGLIARNMRWQLTDMLRRPAANSGGTSILQNLAITSGVDLHVDDMDAWSKFWEVVDTLTDTQREVFDMLWIHEMTQYEAAAMMGLTRDRVKDIWRDVRLHIAKQCGGTSPSFGR